MCQSNSATSCEGRALDSLKRPGSRWLKEYWCPRAHRLLWAYLAHASIAPPCTESTIYDPEKIEILLKALHLVFDGGALERVMLPRVYHYLTEAASRLPSLGVLKEKNGSPGTYTWIEERRREWTTETWDGDIHKYQGSAANTMPSSSQGADRAEPPRTFSGQTRSQPPETLLPAPFLHPQLPDAISIDDDSSSGGSSPSDSRSDTTITPRPTTSSTGASTSTDTTSSSSDPSISDLHKNKTPGEQGTKSYYHGATSGQQGDQSKLQRSPASPRLHHPPPPPPPPLSEEDTNVPIALSTGFLSVNAPPSPPASTIHPWSSVSGPGRQGTRGNTVTNGPLPPSIGHATPIESLESISLGRKTERGPAAVLEPTLFSEDFGTDRNEEHIAGENEGATLLNSSWFNARAGIQHGTVVPLQNENREQDNVLEHYFSGTHIWDEDEDKAENRDIESRERRDRVHGSSAQMELSPGAMSAGPSSSSTSILSGYSGRSRTRIIMKGPFSATAKKPRSRR
ncbi:hypothetical protein LIA77_11995 [Sarocladium implicatum]|nr:hypothetical protein LIA77_11995 [Sarocladium implicatum]